MPDFHDATRLAAHREAAEDKLTAEAIRRADEGTLLLWAELYGGLSVVTRYLNLRNYANYERTADSIALELHERHTARLAAERMQHALPLTLAR